MYTITSDQVADFENETGLSIFRNYSGRNMYGAACVGVSYASLGGFFAACTALADILGTSAQSLANDAVQDSLGLDKISYWPKISFTE